MKNLTVLIQRNYISFSFEMMLFYIVFMVHIVATNVVSIFSFYFVDSYSDTDTFPGISMFGKFGMCYMANWFLYFSFQNQMNQCGCATTQQGIWIRMSIKSFNYFSNEIQFPIYNFLSVQIKSLLLQLKMVKFQKTKIQATHWISKVVYFFNFRY